MPTRFLTLLFLTACAGHDDAPEAQAADLGNTEQVITLAVGESRVLPGGVKVGVVAVPNDSRCPSGVQCIWAGSAAVAISIGFEKADTTATVNSGIDPKTFSYRGWHVVLRQVSPAPTAGQGVPTEQYRVTLGVGRD
jgi:hypothetical protein